MRRYPQPPCTAQKTKLQPAPSIIRCTLPAQNGVSTCSKFHQMHTFKCASHLYNPQDNLRSLGMSYCRVYGMKTRSSRIRNKLSRVAGASVLGTSGVYGGGGSPQRNVRGGISYGQRTFKKQQSIVSHLQCWGDWARNLLLKLLLLVSLLPVSSPCLRYFLHSET